MEKLLVLQKRWEGQLWDDGLYHTEGPYTDSDYEGIFKTPDRIRKYLEEEKRLDITMFQPFSDGERGSIYAVSSNKKKNFQFTWASAQIRF